MLSNVTWTKAKNSCNIYDSFNNPHTHIDQYENGLGLLFCAFIYLYDKGTVVDGEGLKLGQIEGRFDRGLVW